MTANRPQSRQVLQSRHTLKVGANGATALAFLSAPQGVQDIAVIVEAHDNGKPLPPDALARIVKALRIFIGDGSMDAKLQRFARAAKLRTRQGKRKPTGDSTEDAWQVAYAAIVRAHELQADGMAQRQAIAQASRETAAAHGLSLRTVQTDIAAHGESVRQILAAADIIRKRRAGKN